MRWFEIEYFGRRRRVAAARSGRYLWFHLEGRTHRIDLAPTAPPTPLPAGGDLEVRAPTPGRVTAVMVKEGQDVQSGQVALTLEAMKMEYRLVFERTGEVSLVMTAVGDQVVAGQTLVRLAGDG